jgi:hypothetical protein
MITVKFSNCYEIRMGSPYQICRLHLTGEWAPELEQRGWLPVHACSPDGRYLALAEWDTAENKPGFRLVLIDEERKTVEVSQRVLGCCESLAWGEDAILWKAFPPSQGTMAVPFDKPMT